MISSRLLIATICCSIGLTCVLGFTSPSLKTAVFSSNRISYCGAFRTTPSCNYSRKLYLSSSDDEDADPNAEESYSNKAEESVSVVTKKVETVSLEEDEKPYPLDLPSPILLASSIILAIAATGSVFQLAAGDPPNGVAITAAIIAVSFPTSAFFFYAALIKGQAETDADDKEFQSKNGRF